MPNSLPTPSAPNLGPTQTKYSDKSPLVRFANQRFFRALDEMLRSVRVSSVLDAGCGEGEILSRLQGTRTFGIDIDLQRVTIARHREEAEPVGVGDVQRLPFRTEAFDMVLMLEVFEHVGDPPAALSEIVRVCSRYLIASVPNEPWWRIGNMLRFKYLRDLGNTPEHHHHWSTGGFKRFISGSFKVIEVRKPFLWTFLLAEKRPLRSP